MNCAVHTDVDAVGYCRNCGKAMCSTCVRPVRDVLYCEDCLATIMGISAATPAAATGPIVPPPGALPPPPVPSRSTRSEEHTSELQSRLHLVCRLLLEKKQQLCLMQSHRVFCAVRNH